MSATPSDLLNEICRWKLEAKEEDNSRYFYPRPDLETLVSGENCYVIGRKGSGKTAVAEYIKGMESYNIFTVMMSFKNFPFNELYKLKDAGFTRPSQYTTLWKLVIYSAVCSMMSRNEALDAQVSVPLRKAFDLDLEKALASSIASITEKTFELALPVVGGKKGEKRTVVPNDASWTRRVDILEELIANYIDDSRYFIMFDELDEDYTDVLNVDRTSAYFELLVGLFKACYDIRAKLKGKANCHPIVFLRDDIYSLMNDSDRNKWDDVSIVLEWSEGMLERLLAFRISRALSAVGKILSPADAFNEIFSVETVRVGGNRGGRGRNKRTVYQYIFARTLRRPRDVISYLRECARSALDNDLEMISSETLKRAEAAYSRRFRQEFVDEI